MCDQAVRVVAHNASASAVMDKLSQTLGFRVTADVVPGGTLNVDFVVPMSELMSIVLPFQNVIVTQQKDPHCPGRFRIARVWLLARVGEPAGPAGPTRPALAAVAPIPVTKESQENDELYQRAHGMLPPLEHPPDSNPNQFQ